MHTVMEVGERIGGENEQRDGMVHDVVYLPLIYISEPRRQAEISHAVFCLKKKKNKTTKGLF